MENSIIGLEIKGGRVLNKEDVQFKKYNEFNRNIYAANSGLNYNDNTIFDTFILANFNQLRFLKDLTSDRYSSLRYSTINSEENRFEIDDRTDINFYNILHNKKNIFNICDVIEIIHFDNETPPSEIAIKLITTVDTLILSPSQTTFTVDEILSKTYCQDSNVYNQIGTSIKSFASTRVKKLLKLASKVGYQKILSWSRENQEWIISKNNLTFTKVMNARETLLLHIESNGLTTQDSDQLSMEDFGVN